MSSDKRIDVQVLRGWAVFIVVLYHAKLAIFPAGYLGVDIFFVISGYLITKLVKDKIENNDFKFSEFYIRRALRLIPAAYVTFGVTTLLAIVFLSPTAMDAFKVQMFGALTFTANMVLWRQSGYFASSAELKPLLHIWSLAVEEQYYFVLPALLYFTAKRFWLKGAIALLVLSYILCVSTASKGSFSFYLLPTRAWEMLIGSVSALIILNDQWKKWLNFLFWPMFLLTISIPIIKIDLIHPGPIALLICLSTAVVILTRHSVLSSGFLVKIFSKLGDISYSLYLVHWPLFAFLNNIWFSESGDKPPLELRVLLLLVAFILAFLLNKYVEAPFRYKKDLNIKGILKKLLLSSALLLLMPVAISHAMKPQKNYAYLKRENAGFDLACTAARSQFVPDSRCQNAEQPEMMVWGDSFAMQMVPGILSAQPSPAIIQATQGVCGPLLGIAPVQNKTNLTKAWAEDCINFNESVLAYLKKSASIQYVVLSSPFGQYLDYENIEILKKNDGNAFDIHSSSLQSAVSAFKLTISEIKKLGKTPVLIAPPPGSDFDSFSCLERIETNNFILGVSKNCTVSVPAYHESRKKVLLFLHELELDGSVHIIKMDPYLCDGKICQTAIDHISLYRDAVHLSHEGSVYLANKMDLVEKIKKLP
jgi:peptidoglycan/LPS O-acetylase OafA/YrhL